MKGPHVPSPLPSRAQDRTHCSGGPGPQLGTGHAPCQQPGPGPLLCPLLPTQALPGARGGGGFGPWGLCCPCCCHAPTSGSGPCIALWLLRSFLKILVVVRWGGLQEKWVNFTFPESPCPSERVKIEKREAALGRLVLPWAPWHPAGEPWVVAVTRATLPFSMCRRL